MPVSQFFCEGERKGTYGNVGESPSLPPQRLLAVRHHLSLLISHKVPLKSVVRAEVDGHSGVAQ